MTREPCHRLEDYLAHDLADDKRAAFVAHLGGCSSCRLAVARQERPDRLLVGAVEEFNPVPADLVQRIGLQLRHQRRVRRTVALVAAGLAAAVLLAGLLAWPPHRQIPPPDPTPTETSVALPVQGSPPGRTEDVADVRVRIGPGTDTLTLPVPTTNPHVTIVWAYPGLRQRPSAGASESNPDQE
jgi:predicted anti-sigma-YlaC factor YlaD